METQKSLFNLAPDEPLIEYDDFVSTAKRRSYIIVVLALLLLVNAALMWGVNIWTALISVLIGAVQLLIGATLFLRIDSRDDVVGAGNIVVQHSWLVLSVGMAAVAIYPSPFFELPQVYFWIAMLLGFLWMVIGAVNLYQAITLTGARATI